MNSCPTEVPAMQPRTTDRLGLRVWGALSCLVFLLGGFSSVVTEAEPASFTQAKEGPESTWKVGVAQIKITPEQPMQLSGYGGLTKPFTKVAQDLYVKALVLEDNQGRRGVIVTSDLLGFPAAVAEPICERI